MFKVEIAEENKGNAVIIAKVYDGQDYQEAFDAACNARSKEEWRGKWIKFSQLNVSTKWAVIS